MAKRPSRPLTPQQEASLRAYELAHGDGTREAAVAVPNWPSPEALVVRPPVAQRMLNISEAMFWKLVKAGEIPVVRRGPRLTLIPVEGLHAFLRRHAVTAPSLPDAAD